MKAASPGFYEHVRSSHGCRSLAQQCSVSFSSLCSTPPESVSQLIPTGLQNWIASWLFRCWLQVKTRYSMASGSRPLAVMTSRSCMPLRSLVVQAIQCLCFWFPSSPRCAASMCWHSHPSLSKMSLVTQFSSLTLLS